MSWDEIIKGTSGSDVINGGSGDDFLQGRAGGDFLDGGDGDDQLHGDAGDDYLRGGAGDDFLHGGTGIDRAVYSGSIFEYSFGRDGENFYVSHVGGTMIDGDDRLIGIEQLVFADGVIDLFQNNAPIAFNDSASTHEDVGTYSSGSASVLDNDFDWEGQSLTAAAGVYHGVYGTLTLNSDGTYTYSPFASSQALAAGQIVQDSFTYTVSDGNLSDTGTLVITVSGRNDSPVANPDSATTGENSAISIDVLANDSDVDNGAVLTVTAASAPAGKGSASVAGNQVQFNPGSGFDHLAQGASEQIVLSYTITDEHGATSSSTVTVTVTGTNDGPVANPDSAAGTENQVLTIDALANDTDVDDGAVKSLASVSAPAGKGSASIVGGQVRFDPGSDFDHLAEGATETVVLSYTMKDEHGATSSSTISVAVTGTNDGPVANPDVATTGENMAVSIDVLANDSDVDDGAVLGVTAVSPAPGQGSASVVANQIVFDPGTDFDHLAAGESAEVAIGYTVEDEHGASVSSTVTVTVTGTNDAPTVDSGATSSTGSATELPNGDPGENLAVHEAGGTVAFDDLDLSDTHSATATAQGSGYLGTFTIDPVNQSGDSVAWNFEVGDSALDGLEEGEVVTQTYRIEISDGNGGTVSQDVTITLTGAGDENVWYIDNSAAGSANLGTEADPFTSIAAFNAAQGTPGGPAEGETVHLLQGTGTYAEADGINLLDGQVLIGIGQPTIAPTAGDGVNVGENNSISGVDIASGGGAGIADSGGSVGALKVSDVAITTTSGIGVDIDGGGSGVSISGSTIASGSNYAILGANVAGFTLSDSIVSSGASVGGTIAFTDLTGTADFLGNVLNGSGGDTLAIDNGGGSLTLTIADSESGQAVVGTNDPVNGDDGISITTSGDASLTLTVGGVEFQGARSDLLEISALGNSSQDLTITGNDFHNSQASVGGGILLTGGGPSSQLDVDFRIEDNSFTGATSSAITALYGQQSGQVRGNIEGNSIGVNDGVATSEGSSGGGMGIFAALDKTGGAGDASFTLSIVDNAIHDIAQGVAGIYLRSNGGTAEGSAVMEATVIGNTVDELGDFAFTALYAVVGGNGPGDFSELGLDLSDNVLDAGDADYGANAVYLEQASGDAHFYFPGYSGSPDGEYMGGTASADLDAFWTTAGNVFTNGGYPSFPGGVDAGIIGGATGDSFVHPVWP